MKNLILGAALAVSVAGPALAQAVIIEPEAREYIIREGRSSVVIDSEIAVGAVLPADVEFYAIEGEPEYRYTVVNDRRVIVEPDTRRIIQIVD
jgi:hypothetical protein